MTTGDETCSHERSHGTTDAVAAVESSECCGGIDKVRAENVVEG